VSVAIARRRNTLGGELRGAAFVAGAFWFVLAAAMVPCAIYDALTGMGDWRTLFVSAGVTVTLAGMLTLSTRGPAPQPTPRFGFLVLLGLWMLSPLAASLPFLLHGMSVVDALFEAVAGLTTTGATVMTDLDGKPRGLLLWRSVMQWLGGIGILALGLVLLPFLQIGGMQLFSKESSDRGDKPLPRFADFGRRLLFIYTGATVAAVFSFSAVGMTNFDAFNHALTTVATGGFSTHDASMGHYQTNGPLWVGSAFMLLSALPFAFYISLIAKRRGVDWDPQIPVFLALAGAAALSLMIMREGGFQSRAAAEAVFNAVSIITTSGFAASDYSAWGAYAFSLFFLLSFLGGCAGSTTGGVKTYRILVTVAMVRANLRRLIMPNAVTLTRYGDREVDPAVFRSALVFLIAFAVLLMLLTLAMAACDLDMVTSLSGALSALTNVGPGLGPIIGPAGTYQPLPDAAKAVVMLGMLLGRLEILPVLVLLLPEFWRR
jgi:trk system potassium uptake protein TrkH